MSLGFDIAWFRPSRICFACLDIRCRIIGIDRVDRFAWSSCNETIGRQGLEMLATLQSTVVRPSPEESIAQWEVWNPELLLSAH